MAKQPKPLTDGQIRSMLLEMNGTVTKFALTVHVMQSLLVLKGLLTESEISETIEKVRREGKDLLALIAASHPKPPGGIQ
jgi:hypothetical protein